MRIKTEKMCINVNVEEVKRYKERWLCGRRRAERSYSMFKVRRGGHEEKSLSQLRLSQLPSQGS